MRGGSALGHSQQTRATRIRRPLGVGRQHQAVQFRTPEDPMEKQAARTPTTSWTPRPVGRVRRSDGRVRLEIEEPFRPALLGLGGFSHAIVLWSFDRFTSDYHRATLQADLPYAPGHRAGVFACRSPLRPNPIGLTVCPIVAVDEGAGLVEVTAIDAFDETAILDLKPYFAVCDRVREPRVPDFLEGWPEWLPPMGLGLMEGES
jgi:tRNA-Thr(GGU) m(6)t(6)A37 methyltransferase TsaA